MGEDDLVPRVDVPSSQSAAWVHLEAGGNIYSREIILRYLRAWDEPEENTFHAIKYMSTTL